MKVKNVLMIAAVLLAMLAVPAMAAETGDKNMPVKYSVSQTYVISIPDGKDPDEYVNMYGKSEWDKLMNSALYWVEFLIKDFENNLDFFGENA